MHNLASRPNHPVWPVVIAILAAIASLVPAVGVSAQTTDPLGVVQGFVDARNAGDVAGAMALVADDISFVGGLVCTPAVCGGVFTNNLEIQTNINVVKAGLNLKFGPGGWFGRYY